MEGPVQPTAGAHAKKPPEIKYFDRPNLKPCLQLERLEVQFGKCSKYRNHKTGCSNLPLQLDTLIARGDFRHNDREDVRELRPRRSRTSESGILGLTLVKRMGRLLDRKPYRPACAHLGDASPGAGIN
jgi:hypothetical protein